MNPLTERYVWAVLRSVPPAQRADLEPEIRALVDDAVATRRQAGAEPSSAERDALVELGDPEILASRYTGRAMVLIGPSVYLPWRRLMTLLLPLTAAIGAAAAVLAAALEGREMGGLVGYGIWSAIAVATQTAFWVTLVFAVIERFAKPEHTGELGTRWTPDALPDVPTAGRDLSELVTTCGTVAMAATTGGLLIWQQVAAPIVIDGVSHQLIDPALWSSWLPVLLAVLAAEIGFAIVSFVSARWTWVSAAINSGLALAFAVPVVWLLQSGQLLDPGLVEAIRGGGRGQELDTVVTIISVAIVGVTAWEIADAFWQAHRLRAHQSLRPGRGALGRVDDPGR